MVASLAGLSPRHVAQALDGSVVAGQVVAPGPGHSRGDRSMIVKLDARAPDGFLVHSHAGDDFAACRDHVRSRLGIAREDRRREPAPSRPPPAPPPAPSDDALRALKWAARIASEVRPLLGTPGERYLRETRRIDIAAVQDILARADAIGWHGAVYFNEPGHALHGQRLGCIVGIMTDPVSGRPTGAISRTYIGPDGHKVCKAKTLGSPMGCIRLSSDEDVLGGLHLAEGIETGLAAAQLGFRPVWTLGSAGEIAKFPLLAGIESLSICAEPGAAEKAVTACGTRWQDAGREVLIVWPDVGSDLNDEVMAAS